MISPSQIAIDLTGLPQAVQNVVATIDVAIATWTPQERRRVVSIDLDAIAGQLRAKQQGLDRIVSGYRKVGWAVDYDRQTTTETVRVLAFELPD
jgi:hypothetical protein